MSKEFIIWFVILLIIVVIVVVIRIKYRDRFLMALEHKNSEGSEEDYYICSNLYKPEKCQNFLKNANYCDITDCKKCGEFNVIM